ncbi:MAG TPA: nucleotidyl transferase AbiEii/AbiGii toxin family protein [Luteolibacter sp.]
MTAKKFYDWQTAGGVDDVMRLVDCLERADIQWCAIGGVAVNHWAEEPMVTQDVDFVVTAEDVDRAVSVLSEAEFEADRFHGSVNFRGRSKVSIQLSTEEVYLAFPQRAVAADVHGILLRVASLEDTLTGKLLAWGDSSRRQSKRIKDFADIARLVESHPGLWSRLPAELQAQIDKPPGFPSA